MEKYGLHRSLLKTGFCGPESLLPLQWAHPRRHHLLKISV